MSEKMSEKERLELSIQLLNAYNLIEIRDLLKEIHLHMRAWPKDENQRMAGHSELFTELDVMQTEEAERVLQELRLPGLQAALNAALRDDEKED